MVLEHEPIFAVVPKCVYVNCIGVSICVIIDKFYGVEPFSIRVPDIVNVYIPLIGDILNLSDVFGVFEPIPYCISNIFEVSLVRPHCSFRVHGFNFIATSMSMVSLVSLVFVSVCGTLYDQST